MVNTGSQTPSRVTAPRHDVTTRHFRRFILYALLVLWRTRVLYEVRIHTVPFVASLYVVEVNLKL
jgi:hypothetical protein